MAAPFRIYRILCSTPPDLEAERLAFESTLAAFGEHVTFPQQVLFAGASFRPPFDAGRHRAEGEAQCPPLRFLRPHLLHHLAGCRFPGFHRACPSLHSRPCAADAADRRPLQELPGSRGGSAPIPRYACRARHVRPTGISGPCRTLLACFRRSSRHGGKRFKPNPERAAPPASGTPARPIAPPPAGFPRMPPPGGARNPPRTAGFDSSHRNPPLLSCAPSAPADSSESKLPRLVFSHTTSGICR